ncbi:Putative ParB-like nuclease [Methylocella silvestris BL2]|uniref:Putative ParB-like nuclease n=1 Tax=Methylocella silvestris (strain DSM 15510 / CIP 108128 / LMG 27833 / NCIMB 13906 / BL2) TaxID=395965 RepID=B8ESG0_METSB|nr:ParB-like protein [Methylocella silvestris]ACK49850.1 Putative ParB-like nuclease [Methylocella silvestris BL2]
MSDSLKFGIDVSTLRPTQMTVGLREVELKRREWRDADKEERSRILRRHVIPAVVGPKDEPYIVDHHHLARGLLEEDAGRVAVYVIADLSPLPKGEFWTFLDNSAWCHAYDRHGRRRELDDIPKRMADLADDPYRSLVGALIRQGGCAKSDKPFFEFLWADFLRRRIDEDVVEKNFDKALAEALLLAKSDKAKSLPGWSGVSSQGD